LENQGLVNKFQDFCGKKGYSFKNFNEQTVVHFIMYLDSKNCHFSLIGQIKPAISLLERMRGFEKNSFYTASGHCLRSSKKKSSRVQRAGEKSGRAAGRYIDKAHQPALGTPLGERRKA
jgi:hypothetical protein